MDTAATSPLYVGAMFDNIEALKSLCRKYSINNAFEYKVTRSSTTRYTILCKAKGCPERLHSSTIEAASLSHMQFSALKTLETGFGSSTIYEMSCNPKQTTSSWTMPLLLSFSQIDKRALSKELYGCFPSPPMHISSVIFTRICDTVISRPISLNLSTLNLWETQVV
jgi:hypothetical protein